MAETALLELQQLRDIVTEARRPGLGVSIKSRRYQFRTYQKCFIAKEFVSWIVEHGHAQGREAAVTLGRRMSSVGLLNHVLYEKPFNDAMLYFRFQVRTRLSSCAVPAMPSCCCLRRCALCILHGEFTHA